MNTLPIDQIEEVKELCSDVRVHWEAGQVYLFLQDLKLPQGCNPEKVDALLCPMPRDGYPSRLFFAQQVQSLVARNWNGTMRILERNWHAFSWQYQAQSERLAQMVSIHLRGLRP